MEKLYWLWLQCALGQGNAASDIIVKEQISPEMLYRSSEKELLAQNILPQGLIKKLKRCPLDKAEKIYRQCQALKIWLMTPDDEDFPQRLRNIYQIPLVLYGVGSRSVLNRELLLTMVGTRKATAIGCNSATDLAQDLVQYGFGIVSGMALGIDSCCHKGALDMGGITIGVAGCGLDVNYPNGNVELRRAIARKGAIISEYPPGVQAKPWNFPVRNRIVSGLSLGTVVVEASAKSGTLITAELALQQGRDVFALPTDLYNNRGEGNLNLIGQGATIVFSAESIAEEYSALYGDKMSKTIESRMRLRRQGHAESFTIPPQKEEMLPLQTPVEKPAVKKEVRTPVQEALPEGLDPTSQAVLRCISERPLRVEEISLICGIDMQETLAILSELEIDGHAKAYPGKQFGR